MTYRTIIDNYILDVNNSVNILSRFIDMYKSSIENLKLLENTQKIHTKEIDKSIDKIKKIGDIIDELLELNDDTICTYIKYMEKKNCNIISYFEARDICMELEESYKKIT